MLKKLNKSLFSYLSLFSILFNVLQPFALVYTLFTNPTSVVASDTTGVSYSDYSHNFTITGTGSYALYYKTDSIIEAVHGTAPETIYAGTKSASDSVGHIVERGILKTGEEAIYFVSDSGHSTETARVSSASIELSESEIAWLNNPDTYGDLQTYTTYHAPFNQDVSVTFTSLPANPGSLSFHEVTLSSDQVDSAEAVTTTAYEITSDMEDGTFTYDLTLPNPSPVDSKNLSVRYSEDGVNFTSTHNTRFSGTTAIVSNLDHFTTFTIGVGKYITISSPTELSLFGGTSNIISIEVDANNDPEGISRVHMRYSPVGETCQQQYTAPYSNNIGDLTQDGYKYVGTWDISSLPTGLYKLCALMHRDSSLPSEGYVAANHAEVEIVVDNSGPEAPVITAPSSEQYFNLTPILNQWSSVTDPSGIDHYRVQYEYDDHHTFSGYPYREVSGTSRNHTPNIGEQGGVTIWVQAIDNLGNEGAWSTPVHYTYDATAPAIPTLISPVNGAYVSGNPLEKWSVVSDAFKYLYESSLDSSFATPAYSTEVSTNSRTVGGTQTIDFWWRVKAVDLAGNESDWSTAWIMHLDNTAPTSPTVYGFDNPTLSCGDITNSKLVTIQWGGATDSNGIDKYEYNIDYPKVGGGRGSWTTYFTTTQYRGSLNEGTHYIKLRAIDQAGNKSDWSNICSVAYDTTVPTSTITTPINTATNQTVVTNTWDGLIEGTASDDVALDHVELSIMHSSGEYWNGTAWVAGTESTVRVDATGTDSWSYTLPSPLEDTYTITSHAVDTAGNVESSYVVTIILDKTNPEVDLSISPTDPDGGNGWYITNPTITLTATDANNIEKIEYQWDSGTGSWATYSVPFQTPGEGAHVLYYRAYDKAGNVSDTGVKNVRFDNTELEEGPHNVSVSPNPTSGETSTVTWEEATDNTGIDHYQVEWSYDGTTYSDNLGSDVRSHEIDRLTEGVWSVVVRAYDGEGHNKDASVSLTVDRTAPSAPVLVLGATGTGSSALSWDAVAGATGYTLWYGTTSGDYIYGANVGNVTSYTVQGLAAGSYYFVARAYDGAGNSSGDSNEVSTGTLAGAAVAEGNTPAEGFVPAGEVLGDKDETPTNEPINETGGGDILGDQATGFSRWNWLWLILLVMIVYYLYHRSKRKQSK